MIEAGRFYVLKRGASLWIVGGARQLRNKDVVFTIESHSEHGPVWVLTRFGTGVIEWMGLFEVPHT